MKKELHFMQSKFFNQANGFPENRFPLIWQMIKWADWQLPSLSLSHKSHVSSSVEKSTLFSPTMCIIIVCHNCYICIFTGFVPALVMDYRTVSFIEWKVLSYSHQKPCQQIQWGPEEQYVPVWYRYASSSIKYVINSIHR